MHFSIYRPPSTRWPAERIASRHPGGLAIDAASLREERRHEAWSSSATSTVGSAHRRAAPAPGRTLPAPEALELRQIVCDAADARLFNVALTPDFNWAHRNHFHLEVTAGSPWFYVH